MPEIKFKHVVSCSSEDALFPADNLLLTESFKKWKCKQGEKQASIILQLEQSSNIQSIDVGNEGSAFVEILVGRSADKEDNYDVLLASQSFLSPVESRQETNFNRVRIFNREHLEKNAADQKWDRIKIICSQPYNKNIGYGLSFVRAHAPSSPPPTTTAAEKPSTSLGKFTLKSEEDAEKPLAPGSLFKQRSKAMDENEPISGPSAIKMATNEYVQKQKTAVNESKKTENSTGSTSKKDEPPRKPTQNEDRSRKTSPKRKSPPISNERARKTSPERRKSPVPKLTTKKLPKKYVNFNKLFDGVVFVLSGFENPYRAQLRDKAMQMGAQYKGDWGKGCTHLICAFSNTPKYNQVKNSRDRGKIVKKDWILDSFKEKKRLPSCKYYFEKSSIPDSDDDYEIVAKSEDAASLTGRQKSESPPPKKPKSDVAKKNAYEASTDEIDTDDEIERVRAKTKLKTDNPAKTPDDNEIKPKSSTNGENSSMKRNTNDIPTSATDAKHETNVAERSTSTIPKSTFEEKNDEDLPELPNFFDSMKFLLYGDFSAAERKQLNRYIVAFDGRVEQYMSPNVTHVLTHKSWNDDFDEALKENSNLFFLQPEWVIECGRKGTYVDPSRFVVIKN